MKTNFLDSILAVRRAGLLTWAADQPQQYFGNTFFGNEVIKTETGFKLESFELGKCESRRSRYNYYFDKKGHLTGYDCLLGNEKDEKFVLHLASESIGSDRYKNAFDFVDRFKSENRSYLGA